MTKTRSRMQIDWHLAIFFFIAYAIAWPIAFLFGVDEELIRTNHSSPAATLIIYLPKFAFTISGVILFWFNGQTKEMWTRLTHWRVRLFWYALAYFGPALLYLASAWISSDQSLSPRFDSYTPWMLTVATQSGIFFYFIFRGGLGEEIGLRGFALTRLQTRHSPLKASFIIGFWWGLWHLPAWIGRPALEVIVVWLGVIAFSIIFTWFYNNTLSLPVVMLLHAALNSFDDVYENIFPFLVNIDWELPYVAGILLIGIALSFIVNVPSSKPLKYKENRMGVGLNIGLWIVQVSLLGIYGAYGVYKTFFTEKAKEKMNWTKGRSDNFIRFVGITELLGAIGAVFPMLTGAFSWLTPIAAIGLTILQGFAIFTEHLPKQEFKFLPLNLYFAAMSIFVVIGRWSLLANNL